VTPADAGESPTSSPGDARRLRAGQRTAWTVHETLRTIYAIVSG
jgi:uncharacterized cupin superfamily protein